MNKTRLFLVSYLISLILLLASCDEKSSDPPILLPSKTAASIFIGNEGLFTHGDATLTYIDVTGNQTVQNAFYKANNRQLGDVLQSMYLFEDKVYLVVNNSNKIEMINRNDLKSTGIIQNLQSPRYMAFVSKTKAYVSGFYTNELKIVNPTTSAISGSVQIGGWQEDLLLSNNKLFVTDFQHNRILVINSQTDQINDSIQVALNPTSLALDQYNRLWVGCNGDADSAASVFCIDASTYQVLKKIKLKGSLLRKIALSDKINESLFILSDNVQKIDFSDSTFSVTEIIPNPGSGHNYYGLGVDPKTSDLYVSDAYKFTTTSLIVHFDKSGMLIGQFLGGLNSSSFLFYYE